MKRWMLQPVRRCSTGARPRYLTPRVANCTGGAREEPRYLIPRVANCANGARQ